MAVQQEHIDGAVTWRILLKRRRRRLCCRFDRFRQPMNSTSSKEVFYCSHRPKRAVFELWAPHDADRQTDGRTDRSIA